MKRASRHIICLIHALLSAFCLNGQTTDAAVSESDELLNRYELACGQCLDLKNQVNEGVHVSRKDASDVIDRFVSLNTLIKSSSEDLNPVQRTRFEAISRWFSTGERPLVLDHESLVRIIEETTLAASRNSIRIKVIPYNPAPIQEARTDERNTGLKTYILASVSLPLPSYGAMVGIRYGRWGGYARFSSNFRSQDHAYTCLGNGTIEGGGSIWSGGSETRSEFKTGAGVLYGPADWFSIYAGMGYGRSELYWDDIDGNWVKVSDLSFKGPSLEAGVLASWKFLTLGAGVSTISFRRVSLDLCLGVSF